MNKQYGVILAAPPWQYSNSGIRGAAENHYPTMSTRELIALPVKKMAAKDSILIMWATMPLLETAFPIIKSWGFQYKTAMPWVKLADVPMTTLWGDVVLRPIAGQGWWVKGATELILICVRGNAKYPDNPPMGLISKRFQHSKKPSNVHEYAELFPPPYLELFARRPREGWDVWGNEVDSTIEITTTAA